MDINHQSCPPSYKLLNDLNKIAGYMNYNSYKKDMLVELCVGNYVTSNGIVNGAIGSFKTSTYCEKTIIWIMFCNSKIGTLNIYVYSHYYDNNIESKCTPIELIIKDIRVGKSQSFIITRIQFQIQLATTITIHSSQGLSLDELVFDPTNVKKHGLTYTTLFHIPTKEKLFLLTPFQHENFYVDLKVHMEMNRLKTIATWILLIFQFKNLHNSHVIIQTLNTTSLCQHFENINDDHDLLYYKMRPSSLWDSLDFE
jgi:hypothetical protein